MADYADVRAKAGLQDRAAVLCLVCLVLVNTACATFTPDIQDPYVQGAIAAGAADTATTYKALEISGVDEANPVLAICGKGEGKAAGVALCSAALKAAWIITATSIENALHLDGWYKRILWLIPIALWSGAAVWNATVIW